MRLTAPMATEIDYDRRWRNASIPTAFRNLTLDDWQPYNAATVEAHKAAVRLANELPYRRKPKEWTKAARAILGVGMSIWGPPGSGKTSLACATLTTAHLMHGATIHYLKIADFIPRSQELIAYERDPARREANQDRYLTLLEERLRASRVSLLVLDDLGQEYGGGTGYGRNMIVRLLRARFEHARPTIVTTNLHPKEWHTYDLSLANFRSAALPSFTVSGMDWRNAA